MIKISDTIKAFPRRCCQFLRLQAYNTATSGGRSQERYRRIALSALASAGARGVAILTTLVSVPLTLNYLGPERYGLWMIISSFIAFLGLSNFGLGAGLRNALAEAHGQEDRETAAQYVSGAFGMLAGISLLLALIFGLLYPFIPWPRLFNVTSAQAIAEAGPAVLVFFFCFLLKQFLSLIDNIQIGYQEGYKNSLWVGLGNVLGLAGVLTAIYLKAGLPWLVLAMAGGPLLGALLNGFFLFSYERPWLLPRWAKPSPAALKKVTHIGMLFFVLQIANILGNESNNLVLAQMLGAATVTQFNVPMKLFYFTPFILSFFLDPLWPAYGEALARRDVAWIKKTFVRSIILALSVNLPATVLLVAFAPKILYFWVGDKVTPSFSLLAGLGIWTVLNSALGPLAMLLNGTNAINFQMICWLLNGVVNLALSITLVHFIGISGVIFGSVISFILCVLIPSTFYVPRLFARWNHFGLNKI